MNVIPRPSQSTRQPASPPCTLDGKLAKNQPAASTRQACRKDTMQERKQFVVTCKDCHRDVPSGVKEFPFKSIAVTCPLCKEQRRYLPSEVFLGRPNHLVAKQARA